MFKVQSPMRFDLAGGTLDLWPIWAMLGHATTVNASINLYTECEIAPLESQKVEIESLDFKKKWSFKNLQELLNSSDKDLLFYQAHLRHWIPQQGFSMRTRSESPIGGGLGGSSSLSVSVYKTFLQWQNKKEDIHQIVRACSNIEAYILKTPTGTQDYYGAAAVGLNLIDFDFSGMQLQTMTEAKKDIADKLLLIYTGKSHHSGINNWQVLKKFIDGDAVTQKALLALQKTAQAMKQACLQKDWKLIPELFDEEYQARLLLADSFVSPEILKLKELSSRISGVEGFKICGAGGGGCVGLWMDASQRTNIQKKIEQAGFQVLSVKIL